MQFTNSDLKTYAENYFNIKKADVDEFRGQVKRLRDNLTEYINEHPGYGLVKMLHSGSVRKGTAIKTLNDMDVAVYVEKTAVNVDDESAILHFVHDALVEIYTEKRNMKPEQFSIGHHCVKVSFRGSGLDVDVVPVIPNGEADDRGHLITKDTGVRVLTSIPLHLEFIRKRKNAQPNFAQMVRITKWWRDQRGFKFKSFLMELIWAHIADTEGISIEIAQALKQFFRYIITTELKSAIIFTDYYKSSEVTLSAFGSNIFDPVNPDNNVGQSLDEQKRERIIDEAEEALAFLTHAEQASTKGVAVDRLKEIFGSSFSL